MVTDHHISELLKWLSLSESFQISDKIAVHHSKESGRGVSLIKGNIKPNELLISIPPTHQLNYETALKHINEFRSPSKRKDLVTSSIADELAFDPRYKAYELLSESFLESMSSFQMLLLYILAEWKLLPLWSVGHACFKSFWQPFFDVWPDTQELVSIPTFWLHDQSESNLIELLPDACQKHMNRISSLFQADWAVLEPIIKQWIELAPSNTNLAACFQDCLLIYFIINSRCLYCNIPRKRDDTTSCFTMVPFVDFMNHTPDVGTHCVPKVIQSKTNSSVLGNFLIYCGGNTKYQTVGEPILLNYGAHPNEFLMNEYGFVLRHNFSDFLDLTSDIEELFYGITDFEKSRQAIKFLKDNDYWGDYTINRHDVNYRLLVTLSLYATFDFRRIEKFIAGYISEDFFMPKISELLKSLLLETKKKCLHRMNKVDQLLLQDNNPSMKFCLKNIQIIYESYLDIIENHI